MYFRDVFFILCLTKRDSLFFYENERNLELYAEESNIQQDLGI